MTPTGRTFTVPHPGGRLDAVLRVAHPGISRRLLARVIAEGTVRVNGRRVAKGFRVVPGDHVTLPDLPTRPSPEPDLGVPVLHCDPALVIVEKPGGVPGHAVDPRERGTVAAYLLAHYPETVGIGDPLGPGLVHRLDTGTSGLLVAARSRDVHAALRGAMRARMVVKHYLAVVPGEATGGRIDVPLAHDRSDRRRMMAARPGQRAWPAETSVRVLRRTAVRSLVQATIRSGVTHQVRVHLARLGLPVLGDALYGVAGPLAPGRHALHAAGIAFPHPATGRLFTLASPLPVDLARLLA